MCTSDSEKGKVTTKEDIYGQYAGSKSCLNCHKNIYENHLHTEHHLTSSPANEKTILGSFQPPKNVFAFDPFTRIAMEKMDSSFYQVLYNNEREVTREKFDIVVGSGRKGQSYLSWLKQRLVQLPITYFTPASQWSNSPGYAPYVPVLNRPITSRCLECHSTYFEKISDTSHRLEEFDQKKIIYGIECERCHGPAAQHVEYHTRFKTTVAKYIINPAKLPRERLLDLCALCHGGALSKTKPSFSFQAGDTLSNYFSLQNAMLNADNIDVHGNQYGLLALSKCFKMSYLTCINCHSVHENEQGKIKVFSQRCINCHNEAHGKICKMTASIGPSIADNCIDCHMPKQLSHAVSVYLQGDDKPTSALMRSHYIKVYPDETNKFLKAIKEHTKSL